MTELVASIHRLELSGFAEIGAGARSTNVYLIAGENPALVGAGHPANAAELAAKLAEHDLSPSDIRRVVVGSWAPECLGGCAAFVNADVFVSSPDLIAPRAWNGWSDGRRASVLGLADEVFERVDGWTRADLAPWLSRAFPSISNHLDFLPLRTGHTVTASELELEVVAAPGPDPGHALLWNAELGVCFCADFELDGLPTFTESARDYMVSLDRAMDLSPTWLLPTHGTPSPRGAWTLRRLARFCANYLSNAPATLLESKTLLEIVDGDLGYLPEHPVPYLEAVRRHRPFIEELVRSRVIGAEGEGLNRRYGAQ